MNDTNCYYVFKQQDITIKENAVLVTCLLAIDIFIVTSNFLLMHGIRKTSTNKKMSQTKKLFLYLSSIDLVTGLVTIPIQISMIALGRNATCFQVGVQAFFNALTPLIAMFTIFTLSILRYFSIKRPMMIIKSETIFWSLILQFLVAMVLTVFYVISSQVPDSDMLMGVFFTLVTVLCIGLVGIILIMNTVLYRSLSPTTCNKRDIVVKTTSDFLAADGAAATHLQKQTLNQRKATGTLLLISCALVVCYIPNGVVFGLISYSELNNSDRGEELYSLYSPWAHVPMLLNACVDSFIYIVRKEKIYKYYKELFVQFVVTLDGVRKKAEVKKRDDVTLEEKSCTGDKHSTVSSLVSSPVSDSIVTIGFDSAQHRSDKHQQCI